MYKFHCNRENLELTINVTTTGQQVKCRFHYRENRNEGDLHFDPLCNLETQKFEGKTYATTMVVMLRVAFAVMNRHRSHGFQTTYDGSNDLSTMSRLRMPTYRLKLMETSQARYDGEGTFTCMPCLYVNE
jgi:hypothetical protein